MSMDIYEIRKANLLTLIGTRRKAECAELWGMSPAHLSQILSDKTSKNLGDQAARRIEDAQALPHGWLDRWQVDMGSQGDQAARPHKSAADLVRQMLENHGRGLSAEARGRVLAALDEKPAEPSNVITADFSRPGKVGDEVWIAHYDVRGSQGGGQVPHDYPEMFQDVRVSPKHLRSLGVEFLDHNHLKMVTGWGQSMEPTIKNLDPLIVDVTIQEFVGDGIYLFVWDDMLYIKRLQVSDEDHFEMISDNAKHKDRMIRRDATFIRARVLYVWNGHAV